MSIMEALSTTGGVTKTSDTKRKRPFCVPYRAARDSGNHLPVDIGKDSRRANRGRETHCMAGDILVVPSSSAKKASQRALEAAIQAANR